MWFKKVRINGDYPVNWNWYLQDEGSVQLCNIADFLDMIMFYCTIVVVFVTCILIQVIWWSLDRNLDHRYLYTIPLDYLEIYLYSREISRSLYWLLEELGRYLVGAYKEGGKITSADMMKKSYKGYLLFEKNIKLRMVELEAALSGESSVEAPSSRLVFSQGYNRGGYMIEIAWIIGPSIILLLIGIPSIYLLYSMEVWWDGDLTIKIIGRQWFWTYEVCVNDWHIQFDSYTLGLEDIRMFRLLEVDNPLWVPVRVPIRLLVTSLDVILSFGVPSLGLKIDAIPNRLTYGGVYILRESEYIGYCSELCGTGLSNMNIVIKSVSTPDFKCWFLSLME